ncbi:MAG: alpha/beta hydrolase [Rhizobiaceae bacterium]|nr:alpha/beta hydrolase [Rhizobiaceae bacterium]MCZ8353054.1 alpha/beta hydrolase [Rhizobium sp.]
MGSITVDPGAHLAVSGEEDRPISPEKSGKLHEAIAGSRFAAVSGAGHAVMIEKPDAFNRMLKTFQVQAG